MLCSSLGLWLVPNCYTLRHARGYGRSALRNWLFQVSKDGNNWTTLYTHSDDCALNEPGSTASWDLKVSDEEKQGNAHVFDESVYLYIYIYRN